MTKAELIPVLDKDRNVVLLDIFIDGVWHGSRRTKAHCELYLAYRGIFLAPSEISPEY